MNLWSDDPSERFAAAQDPAFIADWPMRIGSTAPMQPWPFGMPTSINPYVIFLGPSPGNSPPAAGMGRSSLETYRGPSAGEPHDGLFVKDTRDYWDRVRELGSMIVRMRAPEMPEVKTHALIGQLNLGTGQVGQASNAPIESNYGRWVPEAILDHLRPSYVIALGLKTRLRQPDGTLFDPQRRLNIDWNRPDSAYPLDAYGKSRLGFEVWRRRRPDGGTVTLVLWPQHPSRAPMTNRAIWRESGLEFVQREKRGTG